MFKPVDPKVDIQKLEKEQLDFWRSNRIFKRTTEGREESPRYVFYEGPPTANGQPGSHHVLARAFKDMFPRYKVMNGYYCLRRGGWDTHGLPVEIAVQKELGLTSKEEIEEYGVAAFNEKCRSSVFRNIADWEKLTERIAFWVDLDDAYVTFTNDYIESVWWILKQLWDQDLLYRGYKVVAYSPTSGTPLSSHEVAQGYREVTDPSIYVRFPVKGEPNVYFLAWTTTPWTLPGNAALAVGENVDYVQVEGPLPRGEGTEQLILAESLMGQALVNSEEYKVVKRFKGKDLLGKRYNPLYTFLPTEKDFAYVVSGDFVSTTDGTGIVHIAPAFGQDDSDMGRIHNLPIFITVTDDGRMIDAVDKFKGMWFKDADPEIIMDLKDRGLMYRSQRYTHTYPHNWRDDTPLMYLARETWFIRATDHKERMIQLNNTIKWVPDHIREGRFGNWLVDLKEWALGRERFWGTPLPVWMDDQTGDMLCVGSVEELSELTGRDLTGLDLHRPYVDDITFPNPNGTGGTMRRVPEVIDVWFDSGAMQVAQWGYPWKNQEMFAEQHPADYICEAVDQTRGWFYSLHAISSMLFNTVAFKNVICLGHILDGEGQKMSKSKGNIVDPWSVLDQHGADAFRWYLYTSGPPGDSRRFSVDLVGQVVSKFYNTLWNTYRFFVEYANIDGWTPAKAAPAVEDRDLLDRWILAELHNLVKRVTDAYEDYDVTNATRPVEEFVESLSNWYVRRSRRRFWKSESDKDKLSAYATLYECLKTVSLLLAPAMPFVAEALYRNLVVEMDPEAVDSVHLASWPKANTALIDKGLLDEVGLIRHLVSVGLAARNSARLGVRQPLASATFGVTNASERTIVRNYEDIIKDELNVKEVNLLSEGDHVTSYTLAPVFSKLGRKLKGDMQKVKNALENASPDEAEVWGKTLLSDQGITITVGDQSFELAPDEVEVRQEAAEGFVFFEDRGYVAALDVELTDELINERISREVVRRIQDLRKDADFDIDDHISVKFEATDRFAKAIQQHKDYITRETLAADLQEGTPNDGYHSQTFAFDRELDGEKITIGVRQINA
ncbi:MAG: isoleucine--tRNA ligase [Anaerolineae bacterium]|nr:isoleucine--tRNA ligase [Anaerolineae bacterium]